MWRSHHAFTILPCGLGEWAFRHRSAAGPLFQGHILCPLRVPYTKVPPWHWCDERGLLRPPMKCWFPWSLHRSPQAGSAGGPWLLMPHPPPQKLGSTAKVAFLFTWRNTTKIGWLFQELWMVARVCGYEPLGMLWRWMQAEHSSLEVMKSSIKRV